MSTSYRRVEPVFDSARSGDFRLQASERVVAGRPARRQRGGGGEGSGKDGGNGRGGRGPRRGLAARLRRLVYWCLVLLLWAGIGIVGLIVYYGAQMPSASSWKIPDRPANIKITAVDGSVLANRGTTGGEALALEDMSPWLPQAVIAIEDRRFHGHFGIDPIGLARAFINNATGQPLQGGSTITQQLAKNLFLSHERTFERKVQEVLLSLWLEQRFSKDQILAMYLNRVFFGSNAYGVEAAARRYFGKSARDVTLAEAAILAGLLKAPSRLSPARDPKAAEARAQVVLAAMRQQGVITDSDLADAKSQPAAKARRFWSGAEHYAADLVVEEVRRLIGEPKTDVTVETTVDMRLEKAAETVLQEILEREGAKLDVSQAALVSIDATGAIRALLGGRDYAESQFNRAVKAKRQPGSAFKPFVYAAALEAGMRPQSLRNDAPVRIGNWTPANYDGKFRGEVTLASALAQSLNTVAAQLVMEVGPDEVVSLSHRMGIESQLQANASIALGTSEVSLVELTAAYAPFMNGGYKATPHIVRRITDAEGALLYEADFANPPRVLSEATAATMNTMMKGVVSGGTGRAAALSGWQAAGKTGTTQSFRDALFVGYTSIMTTGIWFGNDDGTYMKKVTGGGLPARAWKDYMSAAMKGYTPTPLFGTANAPAAPVNVPAAPSGSISIDDLLFDDAPASEPVAQQPVASAPDTAAPQTPVRPQAPARVERREAIQPPAPAARAPAPARQPEQARRESDRYYRSPDGEAVPDYREYRAGPDYGAYDDGYGSAPDYREFEASGGYRGGPVPPGDIPGNGASRTTLYDIIMGQ